MFDSILRGNLVTPNGPIRQGWIAVRDGKIAALGEGACPEARSTVDHGEDWLLPGIIDGQVHACSWRGLDGLASTTRSALAGGITTIVDMPYDDPEPLTTVALLERKVETIDRLAHCDVALYATIAKDQPATDIGELARAGICAIKISSFENHPSRFPRIQTDQMLEVLEAAAEAGLAVGLHNEDEPIVKAATARLRAAGRTGIDAHSPSRPAAAELAATAQFLELGAATGAHAHIVHLSVPRGFDLVRFYANSGATAEMCVHYLLFDDAEDGPRLGALMKVNPPIRGGVREQLWAALEEGDVAFVSSDHSGWPLERKQAASIFDVSAGVPGLETLLPSFFTAVQRRGEDGLDYCARFLAENPARFFGLWPQKGALAPGADADVAVLRLGAWTFDASTTQDELNWSPYDGAEFDARIVATYLRGTPSFADGQVLAKPGLGRFCRRVPA